jgi:hypothetical protein
VEIEELTGDVEAYAYAGKHHLTYPRVVITDTASEFVVLEVRNSYIVFPEELQGKEPWKERK